MKRSTLGVSMVLLALAGHGTAWASDLAGHLTGEAQTLAGRVVLTGRDGSAVLITANVRFSSDAEGGRTDVTVKSKSALLAWAEAAIVPGRGDRADPAAEVGAVSLLFASLAGLRVEPSYPVSLGPVSVRGDSRVLVDLAEDVIAWWDGLGAVSYATYRGPTSLIHLSGGALQLSVHGEHALSETSLVSAALIRFGLDPTQVTGGSVVGDDLTVSFKTPIASGTLVASTDPSLPDAFVLEMLAEDGKVFLATLYITQRQDGTWDVRGTSTGWHIPCRCVIEGVGSAGFQPPPAPGG